MVDVWPPLSTCVFIVCFSLVLRDPPAVQVDAELKGNVAKAFFEAVEADKKKVGLHPLHRSRCLCSALCTL